MGLTVNTIYSKSQFMTQIGVIMHHQRQMGLFRANNLPDVGLVWTHLKHAQLGEALALSSQHWPIFTLIAL